MCCFGINNDYFWNLKMKANVNGSVVNYEIAGSGPCLILLHGFSDNLTMWNDQLAQFSDKYRILAYDIRGHGKTKATLDRFTMDIVTKDLHDLMNELEIDRACLLGYSMGGRIAIEFAIRYPHKTTGLISSNFAFKNTDELPTDTEKEQMAKHLALQTRLVGSGDIEVIADVLTERSLSYGFRDQRPSDFLKYKHVKLQNDPKDYVTIVRDSAATISNIPDLTQLMCKTLIIVGENDRLMSIDVARSMASALPNSNIEMLATGHASVVEDPESFNKIVLNFLDRLDDR